MSFGFSFSLPAYQLRGLRSGGGNNPFNQSGPTLDLSFVDGATNVGDQLGPDTYTLDTNFITPQYQVAAQYAVWVDGSGMTQRNFADIVTFTRASTATYFNASGVLTSAAINEARFDYNPATLAARGLLIEEARTNLLLRSAEFSNPYWLLSRATISADVVSAPDGTTTADKLVEDTTAASTHYVYANNVSVTAATTYTFTVFLKAAERTFASIDIADGAGANGGAVGVNLTSGTIGTPFARGTGSNVGATISAINNGWYRVSITAQLGAAATTCDCAIYTATSLLTSGYPATNGDGVSGIYVWGAQLEAGAFPTSYIPTTTTALTRSADVASVNTLSPWYNATEGTLFSQWISAAGPDVGTQAPVAFNDTTASNQMTMGRQSLRIPRLQSLVLGVNQVDVYPSGTIPDNTSVNTVFAYKLNDYAMVYNAGSPATDNSATVPTVTQLQLGRSAVGPSTILNGYLRRITYYPRRLPNADLQTITA